MIKYLIISAILLLSFPLTAQDSQRRITVKFITEQIKIDGVLDETVWETAEYATDFWQYFPIDSLKARYQTSVRVLYDEHFIYAAFRAEAANGKFIVSSLRRDYGGGNSDNVALMFDTFRDGSNAFLFGATPYGVQRDVLVSGGGADYNTTWDMKWQAEGSMHDDHYIVEMAIPFSSLKFKEGDTAWRFQPYRWNLQSNEQSIWGRVPQNQVFSNLAFMGDLVFEKPLGKSHTPFAVIPYINALTDKDYELDKADNRFEFGGDAKVAIGNTMNLDLTINPDFSNVEVDDIFTNLTRFEVFLPEKRQFFIDNSDLFGSFGNIYFDAIPFFSRRIGLARDTSGNLIENRILGGVRLSGKLNENWRLGFLNVQTGEDIRNGIASNNNMMLAVQKKVFSRSNIGFFILNRETFKDYEFLESSDKYNRVMGIDYNLASDDNTWTGKFYLHKSFQPGDAAGNLSSQATATYNTRKYTVIADLVYVDEDFRSDLGFVRRTGIFKSGNGFQRKFYPEKGIINKHTLGLMALYFWQPNLDFKRTDHEYSLYWNAEFKDQSTLVTEVNNQYVYLTRDFDPTRSANGIPLPGNKGYYFNQFTAGYLSNMSKILTYNATANIGQFYNGHVFSFSGGLSLRMQPWASVSMNLRYDGIRLPDPHSDADLWLLTPKVDVTFSKSLFWSTLVQYSNQQDNLGINSRLQWRFAPLSDLYLVYNDNYFTDHFGPRFRSLNLKLTYWLNI
ncbi:MAG TPA: DUF5916 domain-containing protein [Bacteroidales bacterium]|nr:DUF5916 domain-containing protein [Bacteroidales bacterium]